MSWSRKPLEASIEAKAVEYASELGAMLLKLPPTTGRSHFPDRILLHPARPPAFLELKRPGERPEPEQLELLARLRDSGFRATWTDNLVEAQAMIRQALHRVRRSPKKKP